MIAVCQFYFSHRATPVVVNNPSLNGLNPISFILGHIHFIDSCSKLGTAKLHYQGQALRVRAETLLVNFTAP
ncbi:MAG: hypothetical protein ACFB10_02955, partial [Salibacteraceae bacterium]